MSVLSELKELNSDTFVRVCVFFFAFISPGLLSIYSLNSKLFVDLDTVKLLLLALSITAPTFMLFFITTAVLELFLSQINFLPAGRLGGFKDWYITHGLANAQIFYFVSLLSFIFDISLRSFIAWVAVLFLLFTIMEFVRILKLAKSEHFNAQITDPNER